MNNQFSLARRYFLNECRLGLGRIAMASLAAGGLSTFALDRSALATTLSTEKGLAGLPHYPAKVKRVIYLFMAGAPSQLDLFDYKPKLAELEGKPLPPSVIEGQRYAFIQPDAAVLGPRFKFARHGKSGMEISEMLPHLAKIVDRISHCSAVYLQTNSIMPPRN